MRTVLSRPLQLVFSDWAYGVSWRVEANFVKKRTSLNRNTLFRVNCGCFFFVENFCPNFILKLLLFLSHFNLFDGKKKFFEQISQNFFSSFSSLSCDTMS